MSYSSLREMVVARSRALALLSLLTIANIILFLILTFGQRPSLDLAQAKWLDRRDGLDVDNETANLYRKRERDIELFQQRLVEKKHFARFLAQVFDCAKGNALVVNGVTYKPATTKYAGVFAYVIGFDVSGRYLGVKKFISDLAGLPQIVTLDSVSLASSSQADEKVVLRLQLTVLLKTEEP